MMSSLILGQMSDKARPGPARASLRPGPARFTMLVFQARPGPARGPPGPCRALLYVVEDSNRSNGRLRGVRI
jgi:hypothetical protein